MLKHPKHHSAAVTSPPVSRLGLYLQARGIAHAVLGKGIIARVPPRKHLAEFKGTPYLMIPRWAGRSVIVVQLCGFPPGTPSVVKLVLNLANYPINGVKREDWAFELQVFAGDLEEVLRGVLADDVAAAADWIVADIASLLPQAVAGKLEGGVGSWRVLGLSPADHIEAKQQGSSSGSAAVVS